LFDNDILRTCTKRLTLIVRGNSLNLTGFLCFAISSVRTHSELPCTDARTRTGTSLAAKSLHAVRILARTQASNSDKLLKHKHIEEFYILLNRRRIWTVERCCSKIFIFIYNFYYRVYNFILINIKYRTNQKQSNFTRLQLYTKLDSFKTTFFRQAPV